MLFLCRGLSGLVWLAFWFGSLAAILRWEEVQTFLQ
ncbi:hypothetical protein L195_g064302, partial [Trifolium pratense]